MRGSQKTRWDWRDTVYRSFSFPDETSRRHSAIIRRTPQLSGLLAAEAGNAFTQCNAERLAPLQFQCIDHEHEIYSARSDIQVSPPPAEMMIAASVSWQGNECCSYSLGASAGRIQRQTPDPVCDTDIPLRRAAIIVTVLEHYVHRLARPFLPIR